MKKTLPPITSDAEAETLLDQDLTAYLTAENFSPVSFEFLPKTEKINLRVSSALMVKLKAKAAAEKMPYQRYLRLLLEQQLQ